MPVTIKDLAREVGLSTSSVSRILTGKGGKFSDETIHKVRETAKRLNYTPNLYAKSLRERQYDVLGIMVPNVMNPYYAKILEESELECDRMGYTLLVCVSKEKKQREKHYVEYFSRCRVKGVILASYDSANAGEGLRQKGLKVVSLNEHIEDDVINWVSIDNRQAMYDLTQYLINLGHKDIACLYYNNAYRENVSAENRYQGYLDCMTANGYQRDDLVTECTSISAENAMRETRKILCREHIPTAIICHNNEIAIGTYKAVIEAGYRVPEDISIACFDSMIEESVDGTEFTCIQQQIKEMCREAIGILDKDESEQEGRHLRISYTVKIGKTTAAKR